MIKIDDILVTPLDLPRFEPDSWEDFWKIWNEDAVRYIRLKPDSQGNNGTQVWNGFV